MPIDFNDDGTAARNPVPAGLGETVSGGPREPLNLMRILNLAPKSPSAPAGRLTIGARPDCGPGVALSDGSLILFADFGNIPIRTET